MDPPSKKRSIFGFTQLFRGSPTPEDSRDAKMEPVTKLAAPAQPQRELTNASAPHSPVKRASESQLASRKLIGRPQGPSSKLSQSFSASDFTHRPSTTTIATHRRMPGDNPNKPINAMAASVMSHAPVNVIPKSTSFSGVSSTPRNVFRSSALYSRPGPQSYSPRPPVNTLNQSFPPATPGKPARGSSTANVNGRILANTASTELFAMRIQSPPRHLTGEMLAKEVPDDPNRSGSVYADEFLAHYCPPDLDEHQRRQFFCILDLRRLKYAADEVFTKKDWKINILNFGKEYEKSRSLIMLRYGLYEFKTVRASEAVKKEWKQKHGIPDSGDESEVVPKMNGASSKRKADEELTPSSINPLAASVSGANKRARAPEPSVKNKRKADGEPDENHPAKLQKPAAPPSATKSVFESIVNNVQSTPAKPAGKSLFASGAGPKPNGSLGMSVFGAAPKPAAAGGNIFGHLSDGSKGSGNEGADEDSETSSNADEDESEPQDVSQSDEPAASGGVSTPQFFAAAQKPTVNGASATSSEAGDSSQGRSIFDRITKGSDGQPIRKLSPEDGNLFAAPAVKERSVSPTKELPPAAPANNTWNAGTPIKFAGGAAPAFGSAAPKASGTATIDFGAAGFNKTPATSFDGPKEAAPQTLFGAQAKKADDATAPSTANGATPGLFFGAKSADASATAPPLFGGMGASASTSAPLFGGAVSKFGQQKEKDGAKDTSATAPSTSSLFGAQPAATAAPAPSSNNLFQSSSLFGNQNNKTDAAPAAQPPFGNLFTNAQTADAQPEKKASQPASLFAANATPSTNLLFGAAAPASSSSEEPAAKEFAFGATENKSGGSLFGSGASTPAAEPAETKSLFGAAAPAAAPAAETKTLFGAATTTPATETKSLFGATTAAPATKSLFGAAATAPATGTNNLFGGAPATTATETKTLFGAASAAPATQSKSLFGAAAPAPAQEAKPLFGGAATESKPLFGNAAGAADVKPAGLFANSSAAAPASSSMFSFGATQTAATTQPATSQPGSSIFGATGSASFTFSAGPTDASAIKNPFSSDGTYSAPSSFNFGSGEPTSSAAPFTFGGGSTPSISFGGAPDSGAQQTTSGSMFSFGASQQPSSAPVFSQNPPAASIFGSSLAPGGGTSTGTSKSCSSDPTVQKHHLVTRDPDSPFTFGGASSLATTPAATTPEPAAAANAEDGQGTNADGDEAPQEQISLTDGGPGEEDESAVHEVRAKAVKLVTGGGDSDDESGAAGKKSGAPAWKVQGVGPLRVLRNKTTGAVRMLLRAEPRGNVALNKAVLPSFSYKADAKYVKLTTATDDGKGLETWMLQVKTVELAKALAAKLEECKGGNKK